MRLWKKEIEENNLKYYKDKEKIDEQIQIVFLYIFQAFIILKTKVLI